MANKVNKTKMTEREFVRWLEREFGGEVTLRVSLFVPPAKKPFVEDWWKSAERVYYLSASDYGPEVGTPEFVLSPSFFNFDNLVKWSLRHKKYIKRALRGEI